MSEGGSNFILQTSYQYSLNFLRSVESLFLYVGCILILIFNGSVLFQPQHLLWNLFNVADIVSGVFYKKTTPSDFGVVFVIQIII